MELQQVNRQINKQTAQAAQPSPGEWSSGSVSSQQLSLELHHVEREIGKRTRQIALVRETEMDKWRGRNKYIYIYTHACMHARAHTHTACFDL